MIDVVRYIGPDGSDRLGAWLERQNSETRARVQTRIDRMELGNLGDHRGVGAGVFELRIHRGPGYRLYFGRDGDDLVVLLGAGTKQRQARDINRALADWRAYRREKRNADQTS